MTDLKHSYSTGTKRVENSYNNVRAQSKCIKPNWIFERIQTLHILFAIRKHNLVDAIFFSFPSSTSGNYTAELANQCCPMSSFHSGSTVFQIRSLEIHHDANLFVEILRQNIEPSNLYDLN